jgi:restriction endonuclease Mrr
LTSEETRKQMTEEHIKRVIKRIEELAKEGDDQAAHELEDSLYIDVLRAIANGAENPSKLAKEALKAHEIDYTRWYA